MDAPPLYRRMARWPRDFLSARSVVERDALIVKRLLPMVSYRRSLITLLLLLVVPLTLASAFTPRVLESEQAVQTAPVIRGRVTWPDGTGIPGVWVGDTAGGVLTEADGSYVLSGRLPGMYVIWASGLGLSFSPASYSVSLGGQNVTGLDFVAQPAPSPTPPDRSFQPADLVVTKIEALNTGPYRAGTDLQLRYTVRNIGLGLAPDAFCGLYLGKAPGDYSRYLATVPCAPAGGIAPGGAFTSSYHFSLTEADVGDRYFLVSVSLTSTVREESDRRNNSGYFGPFRVAPPLVRLSVGSNPPGARLLIDGQPVAEKVVEAGTSVEVAVDEQPTGEGTRYRFVRWSDGGAATHRVTVQRDLTLVAEVQKQYLVTISAMPADVQSVAGQVWVDSGTAPVLPEAPALVRVEGRSYDFVGWSVNRVPVAGNPPRLEVVDGPVELVARYTPRPQFPVRVRVEPAGSGTVSPTSGDYEGVVQFQAAPRQGYRFVGWLVNGVSGGADPTLAITVDEPKDLVARFQALVRAPAVPRLAATAEGGKPVRLEWTVASGADRYQIERRNSDGRFERLAEVTAGQVTYEDAQVQAGASYSYRIRACAAGTCSAYSSVVEVTVPLEPQLLMRGTSGPCGSTDPPPGSDLYAPESAVSLLAKPGPNCRFSGWLTTPPDLCEGGSLANPCRFTMPNEQTRVEAAFRTLRRGPVKPGIYRDGFWLLRFNLTSGPAEAFYPLRLQPGDIPLIGDWNGDGVKTPGIYRNGWWRLWNHFTWSEWPPDVEEFFFGGLPGDIPVVGDWNGDGIDTVGIYRSGRWLLRNVNSAGTPNIEFSFGGAPGEIPVVGDWDGDGIDTVGVVQGNIWLLQNANASGPADLTFVYGETEDVPVTGDWDGNGTATAGVVRRDTWYLKNTHATGVADIQFRFGDIELPATLLVVQTSDGTSGRSIPFVWR